MKASGVLLIVFFMASGFLGFALGAVDSPRQQLAKGAAPEDIVCNPGLALAMISGNIPVCIKSSSAAELEKRGYSIEILKPAIPVVETKLSPQTQMPQEPTPERSTGTAVVQGESGQVGAVIETVPASSMSVVNLYLTDDDLNVSRSGVDIVKTEGLLEFTINGIPIKGPETMVETGPNTGKFYLRLDLPELINGRPLTQSDIIEIRYHDQSDAAGAQRISITSIPLSKTYAQMQAYGGGQTRIGHEFTVRIYDPDSNLDSRNVDRISLSQLEYRGQGGIRASLASPAFDANSSFLLETGPDTGVFEVVIKIPRTLDGKTIHVGHWYEITYIDRSTPSGTSEKVVLQGRIG